MHEYHHQDLDPHLATNPLLAQPGLDPHLQPGLDPHLNTGLDPHLHTSLSPHLDISDLIAKLNPGHPTIADAATGSRGLEIVGHNLPSAHSPNHGISGQDQDLFHQVTNYVHDTLIDKLGTPDYTSSSVGEPAHIIRHVEHDGFSFADIVNAGASAFLLDATGSPQIASIGGELMERATEYVAPIVCDLASDTWDSIMKSI